MTDTEIIISIIKQIPRGKISTYKDIALAAGLPNGARQVARILHSCSRKHHLPWHRVIGSGGKISLPESSGGAEQEALLLSEAVCVKTGGRIDLAKYRYQFTFSQED
ncbi:MAG: MGMT family protein [Candidatus Cloacimonetes bacterium]|nr:MGMT family protein [Candidatus Cloacimonadota bacterium]